MIPLPSLLYEVKQPKEWLETSGGICVRMLELEAVGNMVPQHSHEHGHTTLIARGSARLWIDGKYEGDFNAPCLKYVEPNRTHTYQALKDHTVLACISKQGE